MKLILSIIQIIVSLFLSLLILLQPQGVGLGKNLGGMGGYSTKRGVDKVVYYLTISLSLIFAATSLVQTLVF